MQQPAAGWADLVIGGFAQLVMAEVIGIGALLAYDAPLPEFIQPAHERFLVVPTRQCQHVRGKFTAYGGSKMGKSMGGRGKLRQARLDHSLYLCGQCSELIRRGWAHLLALRPKRLNAGAHSFNNEQRIAFSGLIE